MVEHDHHERGDPERHRRPAARGEAQHDQGGRPDDQTGQPIERVRKDSDRNFWMSPSEAVEYGLVGKVIKSISDLA
ncbi:MAG: hypothetical protein EBU26_14555 [Verrucomicrobia bacterium]|nr:hypothetical protein [Verrucomicrobiota bacterium]